VPSAAATVDPAPIAQYQLLVASWASNPRFVEAIQELVNNPGMLATDDFRATEFLTGKGFQLPPNATAEIKLPGSGSTFDAGSGSGSIDICVTITVGGTAYVGCATFQPPIVLSGGVV
jgi:hypothetical protein